MDLGYAFLRRSYSQGSRLRHFPYQEERKSKPSATGQTGAQIESHHLPREGQIPSQYLQDEESSLTTARTSSKCREQEAHAFRQSRDVRIRPIHVDHRSHRDRVQMPANGRPQETARTWSDMLRPGETPPAKRNLR